MNDDIIVEMTGVCKTFYQKQRSERLADVLRNLFYPQTREVKALSEIDLCIRRGEIVAYAGPNGAGKSTTIKLLSGMLSPESGRVRVLGMDPVLERVRYVGRIGVLFGQRTELWNDHAVAVSYDWKRVVWEIPRDRYDRMLGVVREMLGLNEFFNTMARELSLGQRMRADLGLALLHEPEVLFLDEPTLGLDVLAKRKMLQFIKQINRERRVTVMVTSHDMSELEQLAGRIVMISKGSIAYDGGFQRLRREFSDRRILLLETEIESAPVLDGATWVSTEGRRHTYHFDAAVTDVANLLLLASEQMRITDVETHRAPIDDVIADIYEHWQRDGKSATR